jgi:hypothetical protein
LSCSQLYGHSPLDPVSQMIGVFGFSAVALVAILVPARRALSVDLAVTLRSD